MIEKIAPNNECREGHSISIGVVDKYIQKVKGLTFKNMNSRLMDPDLHHFKVYERSSEISASEFVNHISQEFKTDMSRYFYCDPSVVDEYTFVSVWSGRTSAIFTSNLISNQCLDELIYVHCDKSIIILVFKRIK